MSHERRSGPDHHTQAANEMTSPNLNLTSSVQPETRVDEACDAFVVLLLTPQGKYLRRAYLNLGAAEKAYKRAQAANKPARMVLCRLLPVMPGDIDGRWRE